MQKNPNILFEIQRKLNFHEIKKKDPKSTLFSIGTKDYSETLLI